MVQAVGVQQRCSLATCHRETEQNAAVKGRLMVKDSPLWATRTVQTAVTAEESTVQVQKQWIQHRVVDSLFVCWILTQEITTLRQAATQM
jgi:hypothetical protein